MDLEKLLRWRDLAQKYHGQEFWSGVFDTPEAKDFWSSFAQGPQAEQGFPRADVYASDTEIILLFELPGLSRGDVEISVQGSQITVKGNVKVPYDGLTTISKERAYGPFERILRLPEPVQQEGARARFVNGLLEIRLLRQRVAEGFSVKIE